MLKVEVIGNLGRDASARQINGRDYVCFDVAHSEKVNGERTTLWVSILWAGNGGNLLQYLRKGATVFVRGDLSTKLYTGKDGRTSISMSVMAREVQVCTFADKEQGQDNNSYKQAPQAKHQQPLAPTAALDDDPDNDLPF